MAHEWGAGFDRSVCDGCPNRIDADDDSGHTLVDMAAKAIKKGFGRGTYRCELCGCYLAGLDHADAPPSECPRIDEHTS